MTPERITEAFLLANRGIFLLEFLIGCFLVDISYKIIKDIYKYCVGVLTNYL